jgi:sugar lactone lactonase YvrE
MLLKKMKRGIYSLLLSVILIHSAKADPSSLELNWELEGLSNPESVIYDAKLNHLYVSNVNGSAIEKDGNGFISIISLNGKMIQEKWVIGLNAPKGLAIFGRTLYTSDIDELVAIDIDSGRITNRFKVNDAQFLNDVAVSRNGDIYVSDMALNRIHVLTEDSFSVWLENEKLESPNGLLVLGDDIILGSWGKMTDGFATEVPGHLKRISIKDKTIKSIGDGSSVGNLDGVEIDNDGDFYVTDWMSGKLLHIEHSGEVSVLLDLPQGSADHEFIMRKNLILIPLMKDNKLLSYTVHH